MARIYVTTIPNGFVNAAKDATDQTARVSVVLVPELGENEAFESSIFAEWPRKVDNLKWQVAVKGQASVDATVETTFSVNAEIETAMWKAIFGVDGDKRATGGNETAAKMRAMQFVSHDAGLLHQRNMRARMLHAVALALAVQVEETKLKLAAPGTPKADTEKLLKTLMMQSDTALRSYVEVLPVSPSVHPVLGMPEMARTFHERVWSTKLEAAFEWWHEALKKTTGAFGDAVWHGLEPFLRRLPADDGPKGFEKVLLLRHHVRMNHDKRDSDPNDLTVYLVDEMSEALSDFDGLRAAQRSAKLITDAEDKLKQNVADGTCQPDGMTAMILRRYRFLEGGVKEHSSGTISADAQRNLMKISREYFASAPFPPTATDKTLEYVDELLGLLENEVPVHRRASLEQDDEVLQAYLNFVLFHWAPMSPTHRSTKAQGAGDPLDVPDFAQVLHLLQSYPALLRPLGLIFDLTFELASGVTDGEISASATIPGVAPADLTVTPSTTAFVVDKTASARRFYTKPRGVGITGRLLNLNAKLNNAASYALATEESDLATQKALHNVNNAQRAEEYKGAASEMDPLPVDPKTVGGRLVMSPPTLKQSSLQAPAAAQTAQVSLLYSNQAADVQATVTEVTEKQIQAGTMRYFAEDLVLGHRVDVSYKDRTGNEKWYALCERDGTYTVRKLGTAGPTEKWRPNTVPEMVADEGFVTLAGTSIETQTANDGQLTKVSPSLFNWVGSPLALEAPKFGEVNETSFPNKKPTDKQMRIGVFPKYEPKSKSQPWTVPLRYAQSYKFRCRVVDLAGNSDPSWMATDDASPLMAVDFRRSDPIDAPKIVLERRIDRNRAPGEQLQRLVIRDGRGSGSRVLAAPRESLRLGELHGLAKQYEWKRTAFERQRLKDDGSFVSVYEAVREGYLSTMDTVNEKQDGDPIFLSQYPGDRAAPSNPYLPDPAAKLARIVPFHQTENASLVVKVSEQTHWFPFATETAWPNVYPVRVRLSTGSRLRFRTDWTKEDEDLPGQSPLIPLLDVTLPKGHVVMLQVNSAGGLDSKQVDPAFQQAISRMRPEPKVEESLWLSSLTGNAGFDSGLMVQPKDILNGLSPRLVDGSIQSAFPTQVITLVHTVRQPLARPETITLVVYRPDGQATADVSGNLKAHWRTSAKVAFEAQWMEIVDDPGKPEPYVVHHSEQAFECVAPTDPDEEPHIVEEFYTPPNPPQSEEEMIKADTYGRDIASGTQHSFRSKRAQEVLYTPVASTRFRDYYPTKENDEDFRCKSLLPTKVVVANSEPPDPLKIRYTLPAFVTDSTYDAGMRTWKTARIVVLRVYFERPMLCSGNKECIGVVVKDPATNATTLSMWGADPTIDPTKVPPSQKDVTAREMTLENFKTDRANNRKVDICTFPSGEKAIVIQYPMLFSSEHRLWYSDICVDTDLVHMPYVQFSLVRYQPDGLVLDQPDINGKRKIKRDLRCSNPLLADFIQVMPDRFLSLTRHNNRKYTVIVYGTFAVDGEQQKPQDSPIVCEIQGRLFYEGKDLGWRPEGAKSIKPNWEKAIDGPCGEKYSGWRIEIELNDSSAMRNYRLRVRERELMEDSTRPNKNPCFRTCYLKLVDLP